MLEPYGRAPTRTTNRHQSTGCRWPRIRSQAVILRATYRPAGNTDAPTRVLDIERPDYDGAFSVARAETQPGEHLIHVQTLDA